MSHEVALPQSSMWPDSLREATHETGVTVTKDLAEVVRASVVELSCRTVEQVFGLSLFDAQRLIINLVRSGWAHVSHDVGDQEKAVYQWA